MKRTSIILAIAAVAAMGIVSSASAQSFSAGDGTGNVLPSHYDSRGHLVAGPETRAIAPDQRGQRGLSAFAAVPDSRRAPIGLPGGSPGYNELLETY